MSKKSKRGMKTGFVRNVDGLGRIVLPKELRTRLSLEEGAGVEIVPCEDGVFLKRYSVTNADLIRLKSDEELAIMFAMLKADLSRLDRPVKPYSGQAVNDNMDWLKQPAGMEHHG